MPAAALLTPNFCKMTSVSHCYDNGIRYVLIMARIIRVKINWTGFIGAPGYTNLHFEPTAGGDITQAVVDNAIAITDTWKTSWRPDTPTNCVTAVDPTVEEFEEVTGTIEAFWTGNPAAGVAGSAGGPYAAGSGFVCNWGTDGVFQGRRVRGRTFIVPIGSTGISSNGTLDDLRLAAWRTATNTFVSAAGAARLVVWKRPFEVLEQPLGGGAYDVNSFTINDKVAQLKSRRD